jgi:hypothetical protein
MADEHDKRAAELEERGWTGAHDIAAELRAAETRGMARGLDLAADWVTENWAIVDKQTAKKTGACIRALKAPEGDRGEPEVPGG